MSDTALTTRLARVLAESLHSSRLIPRQLVLEIGALEGMPPRLEEAFLGLWEQLEAGLADPAARQAAELPLILSRGFDRSTAEENLACYLPEEKILVNRDIFRKRLDRLDFSRLDPGRERLLLDTLHKESIGLNREDVLLYYNLIKINKLGPGDGTREPGLKGKLDLRDDWPEVILSAMERLFPLESTHIMKINSGKAPDREALKKAVELTIKSRKTNPRILARYLASSEGKFARFTRDFMETLARKRGDDPTEILTHCGLYLLLPGLDTPQLDALAFQAPLQAFLSDRIGRVRTVYYAGLLFIHSLSYMLFAQVYEIAMKFQESDPTQRQKLQKLYSTDERLNMLIGNAANMASPKIAAYKSDSIEIMSSFKKHLSQSKRLVQAADLFASDYRL